ncbi:hypothetical protein RM780_15310 [Streptomyces sp. DSM 44917]|uniref:Uncharacterized protein n=1 Tax=Streptomyces boetiae TaxID=3075541 RepID=A0ABU2L9S3_9ACTN|nr:hypothetical protein [Streptomyces sp. DSM 44917]MDT0308320.1 hypothetical protein [Streptomyces sp. DSM 44917]
MTELRTRYAETADASAAYDEAGGRLRALHARAESRDARLARARRELDRAREPAGALARAQYRAGPRLPAGLRLLLGGASPHEEAVARGPSAPRSPGSPARPAPSAGPRARPRRPAPS